MTYIKSNNELLNFVYEKKNIYIFGAGKIAKKIISILPPNGKFQVDGLIVTSIEENQKEELGIPLYEVSNTSLNKQVGVVVGVGKKYRNEVKEILEEYLFRNIIFLTDDYENFLNQEEQRNNELYQSVLEMKKCISRSIPKTRLKGLVLNVCDHCNLNCKSCDHFSPIAPKRFVEVVQIENDLTQLRQIIGESIDLISIMGGEPLLHSNLIEIVQLTRTIFPNTTIWIATNGLLLLKQTDEFWNCCKENEVSIAVTKYPILFDYDAAERKAKEKEVYYFYYNGGNVEKTMGHYPLDLTGKQDAVESFIHCFHANDGCNMLSNGKLYTCTIAPNIPIFCKKYNVDIPLTEEDGVDIYAVTTRRELFELLSRPMPVCRFCDVHRRTFHHSWEQSKGKIEEWT